MTTLFPDDPSVSTAPAAKQRRQRREVLAYSGQPDLTSYDVILVSSSAGKDSQAMLDVVVEQARAAGVLSRVVVVHCDLGRVEWEGTRELAEEHARHYGLRFEVVSRPAGDLLTQVEQRGKWPSPTNRFCTSHHKTNQVAKLMTALATEQRAAGARRVRILDCQGLRAEESPARAKLVPYFYRQEASNGRRQVDTWLPLHTWTTAQVWARIRATGTRYHRAYDLGMPRLSCCFCIYSSPDALLLAGHHNRALLDQYAAVEQRIGHTFKHKLPIAQIRDRVAAGEQPSGPVRTWCM